MCGRYVSIQKPAVLARLFQVDQVTTEPLAVSYNVAPTEQVYVVDEPQGLRRLGTMRWGLIPHWAKHNPGSLNINARAETAAEKPTFRDSMRRRRCLIPASGFYEWGPKQTGRQPYYVTLASGEPMVFAGLGSVWKEPESEELIKSCAILTTHANHKLAPIHTRMPVILPPETWDMWLDGAVQEPAALQPLLVPLPDQTVAYHPVADLVNKVHNKGPENIAQHMTEQSLKGQMGLAELGNL